MKNLFVPGRYPDLLVGLSEPDDAAVWKLDEDRAVIVTTDFFTPVVDDPYDYGQIAAANALSDVYAMGGDPFLALNIAAFPPDLPIDVCSQILKGGAEKCLEANVVISGGHTIQDREPKYGLVVLGFVHPGHVFTKAGARSGDALILTKPLGFGVTTTALKQEKADPNDIAEVVDWMKGLNRSACMLGREFSLHGATDITGFGLLGHGLEMAEASSVGFRLHREAVPFVSGARKYAALWTFPGGASDNRLYFGPKIHFSPGISEEEQMLLFDPQTSGGLLLAVPAGQKETFLARAIKQGQPAWDIGVVTEEPGINVI